jgi:segregation and condensation protein A
MRHITLAEHSFEGPLDLLLHLIEQQQLDITKVSLARVTEQFLAYVRELEQIDVTNLADYLTIAARLLVIKSKAILPSLEVESELAEDKEEDLASRLVVYKQFKEAAKALRKIEQLGQQSFTRNLVFAQRVFFWPDPAVDQTRLRNAAFGIQAALRELDNLPKARVREVVSIQEKIRGLQNYLAGQVETKLSSLLSGAKNKGEVIITFLALLELIKQRLFTVDQDSLFTDITIRQYEATATVTESGDDNATITV